MSNLPRGFWPAHIQEAIDKATPLPHSTDIPRHNPPPPHLAPTNHEYAAANPEINEPVPERVGSIPRMGPRPDGINKDVAVGDLSSNAKGSGARKNSGKIVLSLVPFHLFAGVSRVLMGGMIKYAPWNWAKGMKWSTAFDCTLRHLFKWWYMGEELDQESGEHHLDHVLCNVLFLRHFTLTYSEGDDRPDAFADFAKELDFFNETFDAEAYAERNNL